jgi:hypothetical protein
MVNEGYHEAEENLTQTTKDMHKAIVFNVQSVYQ